VLILALALAKRLGVLDEVVQLLHLVVPGTGAEDR
jgi:hypothetical protein